MMAGRGFGKTRAGAEWVNQHGLPGCAPTRGALVGRTAADVRDTMIEGESGILACSSPSNRPKYEPSKRRVTWPNGMIATCYSADEPDLLRGPQHHWAWCDELAAWRYSDAWDQLNFGLRLGDDPRCVVTTTPRPKRLLFDLVRDRRTVVTRGSTFENRVNLPAVRIEQLRAKYEGTTLGRQELYAELLEDIPGALWTRKILDEHRVKKAPEFLRIVVAIDPAANSDEGADDTGIVVAGLGIDGHGYVLADLTCHESPARWGAIAVGAYHSWRADRIVAEVNHGGEMVLHTIRTADRNAPTKALHASKGKKARAEPISALYEQGRVHHVGGLRDLEDEQCSWVPGISTESPNRVDAVVWALTELMLGAQAPSVGPAQSGLEQTSAWRGR